MREYIMTIHKGKYSCLDEFYTAMAHRNPDDPTELTELSQFYWMMEYVYHHHHDEYDWHVEAQNPTAAIEQYGIPEMYVASHQ